MQIVYRVQIKQFLTGPCTKCQTLNSRVERLAQLISAFLGLPFQEFGSRVCLNFPEFGYWDFPELQILPCCASTPLLLPWPGVPNKCRHKFARGAPATSA